MLPRHVLACRSKKHAAAMQACFDVCTVHACVWNVICLGGSPRALL